MRPLALLLLLPLVAVAQPPDFPAPKTFPPDDATLTKIKDKTAELKKATEKITDPDVLVYLKAAEWIVKHGEWFTEKSGQQTLDVIDAGLERAKNADKKAWLETRGKAVIRGYRSTVDGSIQPFSVRFPDDFDAKKKYRLDVVLHGRDATLTEVKFIAGKEAAKAGKKLDHFEVEVYGRGNNAYRWAGENDVFSVLHAVLQTGAVDGSQIVLRGFSMGGAGTWHLGLHHPFGFAVMGPGAGFSTTREYIGEAKFGKQPDYIEKCLHIYDAVDYAENNFNIPIVAYSGEKDKQKLAADLIEAKLKDFKEPHSFTHVIAPGLEHSQPADWQAKLEVEYQKHLKTPRPEVPERIRFVTYTSRVTGFHQATRAVWASPFAQLKQYEKSVVDGTYKDGNATVVTENVRLLLFSCDKLTGLKSLTVDGQAITNQGGCPPAPGDAPQFKGWLVNVDGKWQPSALPEATAAEWNIKRFGRQGPIDDAFTWPFGVVPPTGKPWHEETAKFADARREEFANNWDKHFRGTLPSDAKAETQVFFGDPQSNPVIAKVLPKLPITWTKEKLVVNGKEYDPKTHLPVLIYPSPVGRGYVVINSGHTFREADLKGTNALLYPRLGDWAVLKAKPTKDDPAGFEVIDAGLFDENWQFPKKK